MAVRISITIADRVFDDIQERMIEDRKSNRSEFIEELIREALIRRREGKLVLKKDEKTER